MTAETLLFLVGSLAFTTVQADEVQSIATRLPIAQTVSSVPFGPTKKRTESIGVDVTAKSAIVMDAVSGQVLFSKDADTAYPIASLTKLLTSMTLLDLKLNLDEKITLEPGDSGIYRSIFAKNEVFTRRELLDAMLIGSSNEAANAIARTAPGGYEVFMQEMRKKARSIGMRKVILKDAAGLSGDNKATAQDIALVLKEALKYPEMQKAMGRSVIDLRNTVGTKPYHINATNLLLSSDLNKGKYRIVAAKTGTLPEAGFCFAQATKEDDHTVISVVLGSDSHFSRFQDVKSMTYWAFGAFEWPTVAARKTVVPALAKTPEIR